MVLPVAGNLADVERKHDRAAYHLRELERLTAGGGDIVHPVAVRRDDHTFEYCLPAQLPVSDNVPLVLGDFLFDLRASLDHLVYQLHVRRFRGRVPPDVERQSAFPVKVIEPKAPIDAWREVKSLSTRHQQQIARLQPHLLDPTSTSFSRFDQGDEVHWQRVGLRDVHELNNLAPVVHEMS